MQNSILSFWGQIAAGLSLLKKKQTNKQTKTWEFWDNVQNMINFGWNAFPTLRAIGQV